MTEPRRLPKHASNSLVAKLLRAGLEEEPSNAVFRRTLAAMGSGIGIASSTSLAAAGSGAGGSATLLIAAKWIGVGTLGGVLTISAATQLGAPIGSRSMARHVEATAMPSQAAAPVPRAAVFPAVSTEAPPPPIPTAPRAQVELPEREDRAISASHPADEASMAATVGLAPSTPLLADQPAPLAAEVSFVDRGWSTMRRKEYASTLAGLDAYERTFPNLSLLPEVLYLRMEAERHLGRTDWARGYARRILAAYPNGPHADRARDVLETK